MSDALEPCVLRGTSTVLRGPGSSNGLPATRLGFSGPKSEAEEIKQQLRAFLQDLLKLELSEGKTLITHARSEAARFLGYEITTFKEDGKRTKRNTNNRGVITMCRSINGGIGLRVPNDVLEEKCRRYMRKGEAIHRAELMEGSDYEIITTYQLEFRGIAEYYRLAYNMSKLGKLRWVMERSLTKTLAAKYKLSVPKVYEKYRAKRMVDGKEYKVFQASLPRPDKEPLLATWGGVSLRWDIKAALQDESQKFYGSNRTELERRLLADFCEMCGSNKDVEVHHVQAMRKLHEYPGRPKPEWVKRMIALRRKTLILCRRCHMAVEYGLPITWPLISPEEVKERRKTMR